MIKEFLASWENDDQLESVEVVRDYLESSPNNVQLKLASDMVGLMLTNKREMSPIVALLNYLNISGFSNLILPNKRDLEEEFSGKLTKWLALTDNDEDENDVFNSWRYPLILSNLLFSMKSDIGCSTSSILKTKAKSIRLKNSICKNESTFSMRFQN